MYFLRSEELFAKIAESLQEDIAGAVVETPRMRVPSKWTLGSLLSDHLCDINSLCRPETRRHFHEFLGTLKRSKKHQIFLYLFKECVQKCRFHGTRLDP